jgi:hypothetical protein
MTMLLREPVAGASVDRCGCSSSNTPISCCGVAHHHSRLFRSSSTIADAKQYPKRLAARSSPFAMADAARNIAS